MSLYLDTSFIVPLHVEEPKSALLHDWIVRVAEPLVVSDLAVAEFASAMSRLVRMGQIELKEASEYFSDLLHWLGRSASRIENLPADIRMAADLVRAPYPPLLAADAVHLATCLRLHATLVTHDKNLLEAANKVGVASLSP